ncbi:hypothetical protein MTP99_000150, partial [Tenebrio molitor]
MLCGRQEKVYWMSSNPSIIHLDLIDKHAVVGGHEDGLGLHEHRKNKLPGDIKIGKINTFAVEEPYLYFIGNG